LELFRLLIPASAHLLAADGVKDIYVTTRTAEQIVQSATRLVALLRTLPPLIDGRFVIKTSSNPVGLENLFGDAGGSAVAIDRSAIGGHGFLLLATRRPANGLDRLIQNTKTLQVASDEGPPCQLFAQQRMRLGARLGCDGLALVIDDSCCASTRSKAAQTWARISIPPESEISNSFMMVRQSSSPCGPSLRGGRVPVCFDDDVTILSVGFTGFFTMVFSRVMFHLFSKSFEDGAGRVKAR
jgi:hypothetical protein